MYQKVQVKKVPYSDWMTEEDKKLVDDFNATGKKLTLDFWREHDSIESLEYDKVDGEYNIIYPDCPEAQALSHLEDEAFDNCQFFDFPIEVLEL